MARHRQDIGAVDFTAHIKRATDALAVVIGDLHNRGLLLSAQISFGRLLSVGIRARSDKQAKAERPAAHEIDIEES